MWERGALLGIAFANHPRCGLALTYTPQRQAISGFSVCARVCARLYCKSSNYAVKGLAPRWLKLCVSERAGNALTALGDVCGTARIFVNIYFPSVVVSY